MNNSLLRRAMALLIAFVLLSSSLPVALAASVDTDAKCELTVTSEYGGTAIEGMRFSLYRVASATGSAPTITALEPYDSLPVNFAALSANDWVKLALTMQSYVISNAIPADAELYTGEDGVVRFSELETGLYLVMASSRSIGYTTYTATPFMVLLPTYSESLGNFVYQASAKAKISASNHYPPYIPVRYSYRTIRVLKRWEGDSTADRPESITVSLYGDGHLYSTAVLSEETSWRAVFSDLSTSVEWTISEDVPKGYVVDISREGDTYTITNTRLEERRVVKNWSGDTLADRPASVKVTLLRDGETYAEAELNPENNWSYLFSDLPIGYHWSLKEETPAGYESEILERNGTFYLTNTKIPTIPEVVPQYEQRLVLKSWVGDRADARPEAISVILMRDGEPYETAVLTAENYWSHLFTRLPVGSVWTVKEEVPEGYVCTIEEDGTTFILTNTKDTPGEKLPQLGLLWWPVPALVTAGLFCFLISLILRRRKEREE